MDTDIHSVPKMRRKLLPTLGIGLLVLVVLGVGGFVTATLLEEHDSFCIACHTLPETTYYNRAHTALTATVPAIPDLATVHYTLSKEHGKPEFTCINCHRGDASLGHRLQTLALGGRDALIFITGKGDPTIEKGKAAQSGLPDAACVSCHTETMLRLQGIPNHFHNALPQTAKLVANGAQWIVPPDEEYRKEILLSGVRTVQTSVTCVSCHIAHKTIPNGVETMFTAREITDIPCQTCHRDDPMQN
jgi:hypothetical protein